MFQVYGLTATNDASYPSVEMRISVKAVTLLNPSDGTTKTLMAPSGNIPCAINSTGAGGKDSSTAYTNQETVWFYLIWGTTPGLNSLNSPNDPTAGPTLPSGYTHYAPLFPLVIQSGPALLSPIVVAGNQVFYRNPSAILVIQGAVSGTTYTQSYAQYIPACAQSYQAEFDVEGSYQSGVYGAQGGALILTSTGYNFLNISIYTDAVTYATNANSLVADCPLDSSMTFKVIFDVTQGVFNSTAWPNLTVFFLGYQFPYGG